MPTFLMQLSYTADSLAAQIKSPQDRMTAAAKPALDAIGGTLVGGGFSFGDYDAVFMFEVADDESAAAVAAAIAAGGAVRQCKTTKLLSGAQWVSALQKAAKVSAVYKPMK